MAPSDSTKGVRNHKQEDRTSFKSERAFYDHSKENRDVKG